jgi:hypothetical protein
MLHVTASPTSLHMHARAWQCRPKHMFTPRCKHTIPSYPDSDFLDDAACIMGTLSMPMHGRHCSNRVMQPASKACKLIAMHELPPSCATMHHPQCTSLAWRHACSYLSSTHTNCLAVTGYNTCQPSQPFSHQLLTQVHGTNLQAQLAASPMIQPSTPTLQSVCAPVHTSHTCNACSYAAPICLPYPTLPFTTPSCQP